MDDDIFHVDKIEKMMKYFFNDLDNEIKLVTSHRQVIDEKGKNYDIFIQLSVYLKRIRL